MAAGHSQRRHFMQSDTQPDGRSESQPGWGHGFLFGTHPRVNEWRIAARLVARMTIGVGLLLVAVGGFKSMLLYAESRRGLETLATIDAAANRALGTGGWVDLSWQDPAGITRQALGVEVTGGLGRKLRIGSTLTRSQLRIRYRPDSARPAVLVVDDVPEQIRRASALSIAGFVAVSAGSFIMLWLAWRRQKSIEEPPEGTGP